MVDLLIKQVTEGLSPAEQRALDVLDSAASSAHLRAFERAAAAITLAGSAHGPPLPADLASRLGRQADEHFALARTPTAGTRRRDARDRPHRRGRSLGCPCRCNALC